MLNKKAQIVFKSGTRAVKEYGNVIWGCIKEVTEVTKSKINANTDRLLFVIDDFGERILISWDDVGNINYV